MAVHYLEIVSEDAASGFRMPTRVPSVRVATRAGPRSGTWGSFSRLTRVVGHSGCRFRPWLQSPSGRPEAARATAYLRRKQWVH